MVTTRWRRRRLFGSLARLVLVVVSLVPVSLLMFRVISTGTFLPSASPLSHHHHMPLDPRLTPTCRPNHVCPALLDLAMVTQLRDVTAKVLLAGDGRGGVRDKERWKGQNHATGLSFPAPKNISINFLILEESFCRVPDLQVIFYVHSAPANRRSRDAIRATWGHPQWFSVLRHKVIFMLGHPMKNDTLSGLLDESWLYHDLLLADFHDTYRNLSYKGVGALWWVSTHCSGPTYVAKTDDDIFVNIFALARLINVHGGDLGGSKMRKGGRGGKEKENTAKEGPEGRTSGQGETGNSERGAGEQFLGGKTVADGSGGGGGKGRGDGAKETGGKRTIKSVEQKTTVVDTKTSEMRTTKETNDNQKSINKKNKGKHLEAKHGNISTVVEKENTNGTQKKAKNQALKIHCLVWEGMPILRDKGNKWYVSPTEFQGDKFPPYCSGSAFLMSWQAAPALVAASASSPFLWVDDAYLTGVLVRDAGVELVHRNSLYELNGNNFLKSLIEGNRVFFHHARHDVKTSENLWEMLVEKEAEVPVTITSAT